MMAEQKSIEHGEPAGPYAPATRGATREWPRQRKILFLLGSSIALWALIISAAFLIF